MYSKSKSNKRAFSFILALCLVLNIVFSFGVFSATVFAVEGEEATKELVYYVAGAAGSDTNDGLSADAPLATVMAAYEKFAGTADDNTVIYIVICGEVHLSESLVDIKTGVSQKVIKKHRGTVVFTSKYKNDDYRGDSVGFYMNNATWNLYGNTTFEYIDIRVGAATFNANYFSFSLGDEVNLNEDDYFADTVVLGLNGATMINNASASMSVKDIVFTMKSGKIGTLIATGLNNQGYKFNASTVFDVTINQEGGEIKWLTLNGSKIVTVENLTVNVCGGMVTEGFKMNYAADTSTEIKESTCVLDLNGKTHVLQVGEGVDLSVIDTANNKKNGTGAGKLRVYGGTGTINTVSQDPNTLMRYLTVLKTEGNFDYYYAHPFNMTVTKYGINLNAEPPMIAFNAAFMANDVVKNNYLDDWGISVKDENGETTYSAKEFGFNENNFARVLVELENSLTDAGIDIEKSVNAYMDFEINGVTERFYNAEHSELTNLKPRDVLTAIADDVNSENGVISATQEEIDKINALVAQFAQNP